MTHLVHLQLWPFLSQTLTISHNVSVYFVRVKHPEGN